MTTIELSTDIEAPVDLCFELSRNIDLEVRAGQEYHLRAVSGVTSGAIGAGQQVGWRTKQFGIAVSHVSEITGFELPRFFQDSMIAGMFRSFQHDHFFEPRGSNATRMRDVLRFSMPFWLLGPLSEKLLRPRLKHLLLLRNKLIQETAERHSL